MHGSRLSPLLGLLLLAAAAAACQAQVFESPIALPPAEIERLEPASATHLENAERFLKLEQWDEAIEAIRRVQESDNGQFVPLPADGEFTQWIPVREFCQRRLAELAFRAPDALQRYRTLIDPLAEQWHRQALAERREDLLRRIIEVAFASSWGDDALLQAGEFRLQASDFTQARDDWQRISPQLTVNPSLAELTRTAVGSPIWLALKKVDWTNQEAAILAAMQEPTTELGGCYPDTALPLADVRARLVLTSILEGSAERAAVELDLLRRLHPQAEGTLAGKRGKYVDLLADLFTQSATWPPRRRSTEWPTFAGNFERNAQAVADIDPAGSPIWTQPLPRLSSDRELVGAARLRVADDMKGLLSYHPVVANGMAYVRADVKQQSLIRAFDLHSGELRWQVDYRLPRRRQNGFGEVASESDLSDSHAGLARFLGVARQTLTVADGKLFARMGSPVSGNSSRTSDRLLSKDQGWLLGLDLRSEGKPLEGFPIRPESSAWAFEGTPIHAAGRIYVVMRRVDGPRSQLHIACFELPTGPAPVDDSQDDARPAGRLRWRTKLASSSTIGGGDIDELGHNLLTLAHGRLYCSTGAGVVACVDLDGKTKWLVAYPRTGLRTTDQERAESHFFRDLTPCMIAGDYVIVAAADCDRLFAIEAASGRLAWTTPPGVAADAIHLLGAAKDKLIVSGDWLYWLDLHSGQLLMQFPQSTATGSGLAPPSPRGFGRGILAGDRIYWPTRESIYVFNQQLTKDGSMQRPVGQRVIPLTPRGASGGNLVLAEGVLLIATGDRLYAFDERGPRDPTPQSVEIR